MLISTTLMILGVITLSKGHPSEVIRTTQSLPSEITGPQLEIPKSVTFGLPQIDFENPRYFPSFYRPGYNQFGRLPIELEMRSIPASYFFHDFGSPQNFHVRHEYGVQGSEMHSSHKSHSPTESPTSSPVPVASPAGSDALGPYKYESFNFKNHAFGFLPRDYQTTPLPNLAATESDFEHNYGTHGATVPSWSLSEPDLLSKYQFGNKIDQTKTSTAVPTASPELSFHQKYGFGPGGRESYAFNHETKPLSHTDSFHNVEHTVESSHTTEAPLKDFSSSEEPQDKVLDTLKIRAPSTFRERQARRGSVPQWKKPVI